ncbi:hypothetical protein WJX74_010442 [Apatococcus lobatus]|uniref:Uncharacterized protein n=1 Tax=Apatococcus lobatus TaxID=904363 RepID=A0AAW1R204_9CHLO
MRRLLRSVAVSQRGVANSSCSSLLAATFPATPRASTVSQESRSFSSSSQETSGSWRHRFRSAFEEWLREKSSRWWLEGVRAQCNKRPELQGRSDEIIAIFASSRDALLQKHEDLASDDRSLLHLNLGCSLLASHKVLSSWIRDEKELLDMLHAQVGGHVSPFFRFMLRSTLYLSPDPFKSTARRLRLLQMEYGSAFQTAMHESDSSLELAVDRCFYRSLFEAEGAPQLTRTCCCSQDVVWFQNLEAHGIGFEHQPGLAAGQSSCCLRIQRLQKR